MSQPSFRKAAARHYRDALYLRANSALGNADHLSGFAAECAIKGLVVDHLGGVLSGPFAIAADGTKLDKHIGAWLWATVSTLAAGRPEPEVVGLFQGSNPFLDWEVGDRYADGLHLSSTTVDAHLDGARRAIEALEAAALSMNNGGA